MGEGGKGGFMEERREIPGAELERSGDDDEVGTRLSPSSSPREGEHSFSIFSPKTKGVVVVEILFCNVDESPSNPFPPEEAGRGGFSYIPPLPPLSSIPSAVVAKEVSKFVVNDEFLSFSFFP